MFFSSVGLCFGLMLKTVLITQGCFINADQGLHRAKAFSTPHPLQLCTRSWEGTQLGQLTPSDQGDIADHMVSCSALKLGKERGSREY